MEDKLNFKRKLLRKICSAGGRKIPDKLYLEMLYQVLPTGQGVLLTRYTQPSSVPIENVSYGLLPCYSAVLIALTTGAGLWGFSKKQLH